ncbi:MAG: alpha/beta fold hydrolase [Gammaproteobacteria bacterium]
MKRFFEDQKGQKIAANLYGKDTNPLVILLHGGGQTRHAWDMASRIISEAGFFVIAYDLRGHGDSFWSKEGDYSISSHKEDLINIINQIGKSANLVGASLGGMTALALSGDIESSPLCQSLVMVDIGIYPDEQGSNKIVEFMQSGKSGFKSLEEAAEAISQYLPHRKKPKDLSGLNKNLKLRDDGKYYWHWDPKFLERKQGKDRGDFFKDQEESAKRVKVPTLLIRGALSDVLTEPDKDLFLKTIVHSEFKEIKEAAHMVAGDKNDIFADSIISFLIKHN